jgi:hypothetical protein
LITLGGVNEVVLILLLKEITSCDKLRLPLRKRNNSEKVRKTSSVKRRRLNMDIAGAHFEEPVARVTNKVGLYSHVADKVTKYYTCIQSEEFLDIPLFSAIYLLYHVYTYCTQTSGKKTGRNRP